MSPEIPTRAQRSTQLIEFVKQELYDYQLGKITRITSQTDLTKQFGFKDDKSIRRRLLDSGFYELRKGLPKKYLQRSNVLSPQEFAFSPSRDLAWLIGAISEGGSVNPDHDYTISMGGYDAENNPVLQAFKSKGEEIFQSNAKIRPTIFRPDGRIYELIEFRNKDVAYTLGNLARGIYPKTITNKHGWILKQSDYLWSFINGIFDTSGSVNINPGKSHIKRIMLNTSYKANAYFITDLLIRLGVKHPTIPKHGMDDKEKIRGINISNVPDLQLITDNITALDPEKEDKLEIIRQLVLKSPRLFYTAPLSDQDMLSEWQKAQGHLGYKPRAADLKRLQKSGVVRYSCDAFSNRFGNGNYKIALANILQILHEQSV